MRIYQLGLIGLLISLLGCTSPEGGNGQASPASRQGAGSSTIITTSTSDKIETDRQSLSLTSLTASLATLSDYRLSIDLSFENDGPGQEQNHWHVSSETLKSEQPSRMRINLASEGFRSSGDISALILARIDGESYLAVPAAGCLTGDDLNYQNEILGSANPDAFLSGLHEASLVSSGEMINDVRSSGYEFNRTNLPLWADAPVSAQGTIYVAEDGGYVTRVLLVMTGTGDFSGQDLEQMGTLTMKVDVMDINLPLDIQPPSACTNPADFPLPTGISDVAYFEDLITYNTLMPLPDVIAFYQLEMANSGWSLVDDDAVFDDSALLIYERDGQVINIVINLDENEGVVEVLISP